MISVKEKLIDDTLQFKKNYKLKKLLTDIGEPQNTFKVINVVGTNGKGSTSHFLSIGLKVKYKKVGLFISPAFLYHNERVQINNECISDEDLKRILNESQILIKKYELTFFEIWTLIAIKYFQEQKVEVAVIEAGIGGLKDATNVFENQIAVCVTSIDYDHVEVLGHTIEEIIFQKISIAKNGTPIFISNDNLKYKNIISKINSNSKIYCKKIKDPIYFQQFNKGLVKKTLNYLDIKFSTETKAPLGRFTILKQNPFLILDGCHNIDGARKIAKQIKNIKNILILFGSSYKKSHLEMIDTLKSTGKKIFLTEFDHQKSWKIDRELYKNENVVQNWKEFYLIHRNENIIVLGSLYFIPLVYEWIKEVN